MAKKKKKKPKKDHWDGLPEERKNPDLAEDQTDLDLKGAFDDEDMVNYAQSKPKEE